MIEEPDMAAPKPKSELRIVAEPDLAEMDRVVHEAASESIPLISLESTLRERFINEMRELEAKRDALVDRRDLFKRQMEAAIAGLDAHIADHNATIDIYRGGLAPQVSQGN
jgi:hypothetical protein